jgi:hypothetical protein
MNEVTRAQVETPDDFGSGDDTEAECKRWSEEIRTASKHFEKWTKQGRNIIRRYRDERDAASAGATKFNILWSNIQVLQPALYAKQPKPQVDRRHLDQDPVGKAASLILERALSHALDEYEFDEVMKAVRDDYLLVGRGTAWVRYEPVYGDEQPDPAGGDATFRPVSFETAPCDYVGWEDFLHGVAPRWQHVPWVARKVHLTRDELVSRFGDEVGKAVPMKTVNGMDKDDAAEYGDVFKRALVWEIWDKGTKTAYWICPGHAQLLDKRKDPLGLREFFPCPRPLLATTTTDSLVPVPDFHEYQDQARELDELSARIACLTKALKVAGVYDGSVSDVQRLLQEGVENELIPVTNWAAFAGNGGMKGSIQFLPLDEIANTLIQLYSARDKVKQDLYEITGLSDIIRGASMASETATAQRIKGQFASLRLTDRQNEVARFARDVIRLKAEIMSEHFAPETLATASGYEHMPGADPAVFQEAVMLLKNDALRGFRIDIETDSTVAVDQQAEQDSRVAFLTAMGGFLREAVPMAQQAPQTAPLMAEMLTFAVRGFKAGRQLEQAFDQFGQMVSDAAKQPQEPPQPDPAQEMALQGEQMKMQALQVKTQADMQKAQVDGQVAALDAQAKQTEHQMKMQEMQMAYEFKVAEHQMKMAELQAKIQQTAITHEQASIQSQQQAEQAEASHGMAMMQAEQKAEQAKQGPTE